MSLLWCPACTRKQLVRFDYKRYKLREDHYFFISFFKCRICSKPFLNAKPGHKGRPNPDFFVPLHELVNRKYVDMAEFEKNLKEFKK